MRPSNFNYITHRKRDGDVAPVGGIVLPFLAAATLLVGDVVFLSAANTVNKSATSADYIKFIGVVVGGRQLYGEVIDPDINQTSVVGQTAALVGEEVLVQITGIAYVVCAAAVAIAAPLQVVTTSGRVDDPAAVAGQIVGTSLELGTGAASVIKMLIRQR